MELIKRLKNPLINWALVEQHAGIDLHAGLERFRTAVSYDVRTVRCDDHTIEGLGLVCGRHVGNKRLKLVFLQGGVRNLSDRSPVLAEFLIGKRAVA